MTTDLGFLSFYSVKSFGILDQADGSRLAAKSFDKDVFSTEKDLANFEKNLFKKTHGSNSEIILLDGLICVYRTNVDLLFYVIGSAQENELVLLSVLNALYDSVSIILRKNVEKKSLLDNMDVVFLVMDEICDDGIILETDAQAIASQCAVRPEDVAFGDQSVSQLGMSLLGSAKDQFKWSLLK